MKSFYITALIGVFLLLDINGVEAQKGMQSGFLMNSLKAKDAKAALENVQYVDSVNYCDSLGRSLLMYASKDGFATGMQNINRQRGRSGSTGS